jgi:prevent-host-death family protein
MMMHQVNIHEAKTHLSKLIEEAVNGQPFVIAKSGKPLVLVTRLDTTHQQKKRVGFLLNQFHVPDDFDQMGSHEIEDLFG